jgi:SHS2 domain-containing protein
MNRHQKIEELKNQAKGVKILMKPFIETLSRLEAEIRALTDGFDIGERVQVTKTCRRGCCNEHEFEGVVEAMTPNGMYNVREDNGTLNEYVYNGDMKRL